MYSSFCQLHRRLFVLLFYENKQFLCEIKVGLYTSLHNKFVFFFLTVVVDIQKEPNKINSNVCLCFRSMVHWYSVTEGIYLICLYHIFQST